MVGASNSKTTSASLTTGSIVEDGDVLAGQTGTAIQFAHVGIVLAIAGAHLPAASRVAVGETFGGTHTVRILSIGRDHTPGAQRTIGRRTWIVGLAAEVVALARDKGKVKVT